MRGASRIRHGRGLSAIEHLGDPARMASSRTEAAIGDQSIPWFAAARRVKESSRSNPSTILDTKKSEIELEVAYVSSCIV